MPSALLPTKLYISSGAIYRQCSKTARKKTIHFTEINVILPSLKPIVIRPSSRNPFLLGTVNLAHIHACLYIPISTRRPWWYRQVALRRLSAEDGLATLFEYITHCLTFDNHYPRLRRGNTFRRVCLSVCVSVLLCSFLSGSNFWKPWPRNFIFSVQVHLLNT